MVTLPGSPPNCAMLSRTHSSAITISSMPALAEPEKPGTPALSSARKPKTLRRWFTPTKDDVVVLREVMAAIDVETGLAVAEAAAMQPHHHGPRCACLCAGRRRVDVEREAILVALRLHVGRAGRRLRSSRPARQAGRRQRPRRSASGRRLGRRPWRTVPRRERKVLRAPGNAGGRVAALHSGRRGIRERRLPPSRRGVFRASSRRGSDRRLRPGLLFHRRRRQRGRRARRRRGAQGDD